MDRLESPQDTARRMPSRWGLRNCPSYAHKSLGLGALLLDARPGEVSSRPSEAHIFGAVLTAEGRHIQWRDDRIYWDGPLQAGRANIVTAGCEPRAFLRNPTRVLHVYLPHRYLGELAREEGWSGSNGALEIVDPRFEQDADLEALSFSLARSLAGDRPALQLYQESLVTALSARILQKFSNFETLRRQKARGGLAPWQLRRVCDAMETNLDGEIGLHALADIAGCTSAHFSRAFKVSTGLAPFAWLQQRRIEWAKQLLSDPQLSLAQVACTVGFSAQPQFTTAFRRVTGLTPGQWRRERLA